MSLYVEMVFLDFPLCGQMVEIRQAKVAKRRKMARFLKHISDKKKRGLVSHSPPDAGLDHLRTDLRVSGTVATVSCTHI